MRSAHRLAGDLHLVAERDALADVRRLAVDGDAAVEDQVFHVAPRADARLRQHLVQLRRIGLGRQHALRRPRRLRAPSASASNDPDTTCAKTSPTSAGGSRRRELGIPRRRRPRRRRPGVRPRSGRALAAVASRRPRRRPRSPRSLRRVGRRLRPAAPPVDGALRSSGAARGSRRGGCGPTLPARIASCALTCCGRRCFAGTAAASGRHAASGGRGGRLRLRLRDRRSAPPPRLHRRGGSGFGSGCRVVSAVTRPPAQADAAAPPRARRLD